MESTGGPPPQWRSRSLSPHAFPGDVQWRQNRVQDAADDAAILFDACRLPHAPQDLLDCVADGEPWYDVEADDGRKIHVVGDYSALRKLFTLPLHGTGDALSIHRVGDCLVVLDANEDAQSDDGDEEKQPKRVPVVSPDMEPARPASGLWSQVRVEGDMVRVYPRMAPAEPVDSPTFAAATPTAACCEWRVHEGLSLFALTPRAVPDVFDAFDIQDLRSKLPSLVKYGTIKGGGDDWESVLGAQYPSLPVYHQQVTEGQVAVMVVSLGDLPQTQALVDAWLSCSLLGSPSLLCFFVDEQGRCRGCRLIGAEDIPLLSSIAAAYSPHRRCLDAEAASSGVRAFEPQTIRETSRGLLETLVNRCDKDGSHVVVFAGPLGSLRVLGAPSPTTDADELSTNLGQEPWTFAIVPLAGSTVPPSESSQLSELQPQTSRDHFRRAHVTQALLMYHAAVRLAQAKATSVATGNVKGVPAGSRWSAKSCQHPRRVRQMMLRAVWALRTATGSESSEPTEDGSSEPEGPSVPRSPSKSATQTPKRFSLLLSSAREFIADTFLAEDTHGDDVLDSVRYLAALRHLHRSTEHLKEYVGVDTGTKADVGAEDFSLSVRRLEERLLAKRTNAHLCLARIWQRQPWTKGDLASPAHGGADGEASTVRCAETDVDKPTLRTLGRAMRELDAVEALVANPPRVATASRPPGLYERSLLASIAKWKADLAHELASLCAQALAPSRQPRVASATPRAGAEHAGAVLFADGDTQVLREYLEAQQRETEESLHPLPAQQERWLQSAISLSLRSMHQLTGLPKEAIDELHLQARALLAQAYGDLGRIYASTGRYTKAMTHAKQGIELFNATKDKFNSGALQLWLCRLQLRMAVPQAAPSAYAANGGGGSGDGGMDDVFLLRGLSAVVVDGTEDVACAQVATALQRAIKGLEDSDAERSLRREGQALLGRVLLRKSLARVARLPQLSAVCRLCEEDSAGVLTGALDIVQAADQNSSVADSKSLPAEDMREAVELLLQASVCLREAADAHLAGIAHVCLAAVYLCWGQDVRQQRLVLTHCQHAQEHLQDVSTGAANPCAAAPAPDDPDMPSECQASARLAAEDSPVAISLRLAVRLLQAKAFRKLGGRAGTQAAAASAGFTSRFIGDTQAGSLLCGIAVDCCRQTASAALAEFRQAQSGTEHNRESAVDAVLHASDVQFSTPAGQATQHQPPPPRIFAGDDQHQALMSYLRQEVNDILVRLLKGVGVGGSSGVGAAGRRHSAPCGESASSGGVELKALYVSLLTAWHAETGLVEAFAALRDHLSGIANPPANPCSDSTNALSPTGDVEADSPACGAE